MLIKSICYSFSRINKILILPIILASFLQNISQTQASQLIEKKNKFNLYGKISFVPDQKFVKSEEVGVGGVNIIYGEKSSTTTDKDGNYEISHETNNDFIEIKLEKDSLPPGAVIIGASSFQFHKSSGYVHKVDFKIKYPLKKINYKFNKKPKDFTFLHLGNNERLPVKIVDEILFLNNQKWTKIKDGAKLANIFDKQFFEASFDKNTLNIDSLNKLKNELALMQNHIQSIKVKILHTEDVSNKALKVLESFLENEFSLSAIGNRKYEINTKEASVNKIQIQVDLKKINNCIAKFGSTVVDINESGYIEINYLEDNKKLIFNCREFVHTFEIPQLSFDSLKQGKIDLKNKMISRDDFKIEYKASRNYNIYSKHIKFDGAYLGKITKTNSQIYLSLKNEKNISLPLTLNLIRPEFFENLPTGAEGEVDIFISKYFEKMRNNQQFFIINSKRLQELRIDRHKINLNSNYTGYVRYSSPNLNTMNIKMVDNSNKQMIEELKYELYKKSRLELQFDYGIRNRDYTTNVFDTNYSLNEVYFINLNSKVFLNNHYGINLNYFTNISPIEMETAILETAEVGHWELNLHALYRWDKKPNKYLSDQYTVFLGIKKIDFTKTKENIQQPIPGEFLAVEIGGEYLVNEIFGKEIDWASQLFLSIQPDKVEQHSFDFNQEFRMSLNFLGSFLPFLKPYYTYSYRYPILEDFAVTFGFKSQYIKREVDNYNLGYISELNYSLYTGIKYQY